ncbi:MAG TPA: hypothetical protein VFG68_13350 [Fimbriiglobus sp.]|nr:hypothetical protein [Fimbriiglobus sp.]
MTAFALVLLIGASADPPPNPTLAELDAVKLKHDQVVNKAWDNILPTFDLTEKEIRQSQVGSDIKLAALKQLKVARTAFEKTGVLLSPKEIRLKSGTNDLHPAIIVGYRPAEIYLSQLWESHEGLLKEYDRVIDTFIRTKDDARAEIMAQEKKVVRAIFEKFPMAPLRVAGDDPVFAKVKEYVSDPAKFIGGKTWDLWRMDGTPLAGLEFRVDGTIGNSDHPNNTRWGIKDTALVVYHKDGKPSTVFSTVRVEKGKLALIGPYLYDTKITHVLREK